MANWSSVVETAATDEVKLAVELANYVATVLTDEATVSIDIAKSAVVMTFLFILVRIPYFGNALS